MNDLITKAEFVEITGYDMVSKQCQVLTDHGIFFVKDRNGEPHTTWYNFNHPAHLRFGLPQSEYDDRYANEPDFSSMDT